MKAIKYFFLVVLLATAGMIRAQDTLRINPNALDSLPTSIHYGDSSQSKTFGIWLYNPTGTTFSDDITFDYEISSGGNSFVSHYASSDSGIIFSPRIVTIPAHDSLLVTGIGFNSGCGEFIIGSSIVVIWPAIQSGNNNLYVPDSSSQVITVLNPLGIENPKLSDLKVYLSGQTLIVTNGTQNLSGDIRIYDMDGQLVKEQKMSLQATIPMQAYAAGTYMVEITLQDNSRAVYKVVKR